MREALRGTAIVFAGGLAAGVVTTIVAARQLDHIIAGLLIGLRPSDWMMVGGATVAMLLVAILAAILPALRASRADPLVTMRFWRWSRAINHEAQQALPSISSCSS